MSKKQIPTGVEVHGGMLRIWFMHEGKRCRESLGVPDTQKNRKLAGELRQSVVYSIRTGTFSYEDSFPNSSKVVKPESGMTVEKLFNTWLGIKRLEISDNSLIRYRSTVDCIIRALGAGRKAEDVKAKDLSVMRNELLEGAQFKNTDKLGRSVVTVNGYLSKALTVFRFAKDNGYVHTDITESVKMLKTSRQRPEPLSNEEFDRLISACRCRQTTNLWTLAVYTGLRHGELAALAWEDIDLVAGTLCVRRNITTAKLFTVPKTDSGTNRIIQLNVNALHALKGQQEITRMGKQHEVNVLTRQRGKSRTDSCTFVFNPSFGSVSGRNGICYSSSSIGHSWNVAIRKSGIQHRNPYQSRHTFACWMLSAGANPYFIASQMGHSSPQMLYQVYGDWMPGNNSEQVELINAKIKQNVPPMPHAATSFR
ncbi:Arm DNA-binding domain-containing protein [Rahnella inusitata]|uniref:Arm DNA-binding domain-containing protein n=1 Tax=Rahnella inusitata TaxID=58169 RepID=UPI0039BDEBAC